MDERKLRLGVGVLVVASLGIGIGLTMFFGAFKTLLTKHYTITAQFPAAPGVGFDTPVRKNGVQIGRVKDIQLLADRQGHVQLTMEIEDRYPIRAGEVPRIGTGSLITGDAIVEFVPASEEQLVRLFDGQGSSLDGQPMPPNNRLDPEELKMAEQPVTDGYYMSVGEVSGDPFKVLVNLEDDMRLTLAAVRQAGQSVDALAADVRQFVGGDQIPVREIAVETQATIEEFHKLLADIRQVTSDPNMRTSLEETLRRFPELMDEAKLTMAGIRRTGEQLDRVGQETQQVMNNINRLTAPFGDRGEEFAEGLVTTVNNLNTTLNQFSSFGERLNAGNGTFRRLVEDEELYWQIRRVVDSVEETTVKVRPIIDDVRIFTDKIARDPRQLGVKGALDRRSSGLGLK